MTKEEIRFGVYGYPENFLKSEEKPRKEEIFAWLSSLHLQALLLDFNQVKSMTDKKLSLFKTLSQENDVKIYLKAPKEIDFITSDKKIQERSMKQLKHCIEIAQKLGSSNLILNLGNGKVENWTKKKKELIALLKPFLKENVNIHIEPAMYTYQFGSLEELIDLCKHLPSVYPSFNLMHLHALHNCNLIYPERIIKLFEEISQVLGEEVLNKLVVQICPLSYEHGRFIPKTFGEAKLGQLSFFDSNFEYFPKAKDYITAIRTLGITPTTFSNTNKKEEAGALRLRDSYFYQKMKEEI